MKYLIFILLLTLSGATYAQTESSLDTIKPLKSRDLNKREKLENYLKTDDSGISSTLGAPKSSLAEPKITGVDINRLELKIPKLDIYQGPPLESNTFTRNPFANDYSFSSGLGISDQLWLSSSSSQNTYPTIGAIRNINLSINYQATDWLIISGGSYAAKYNIGGNSFNDTGVNANMKFILGDRIRFNAFGQYSAYGKRNGINSMKGMYPQSYYGGSLEIKITQKFGIEGGIIRELNPFNGKWENRTYVAPVFYGK